MSKVRKTWTIIAAVLTGSIAVALYTLGPLVEAGLPPGVKFN